ncbi:Peptidyl-tRNA hydrolase 2 [Rhodotorula toruloides]|nr:Peptidyl-tRNA hydrolase 2 [Rhodotorula toruloides]
MVQYIGLGSTLGYTRGGSSSAKDDEDDSEYETESEEGDADELKAVKAQGDEPCKLVLVVRSDLNMTKGKIAAQCGHATLACYKTLMRSNPKLVQHWERTGQAKIAVKCESEEELEILQASAKSLGVCARSIQDAGRTQVDPGTTTVLGIGPAPARILDVGSTNATLSFDKTGLALRGPSGRSCSGMSVRPPSTSSSPQRLTCSSAMTRRQRHESLAKHDDFLSESDLSSSSSEEEKRRSHSPGAVYRDNPSRSSLSRRPTSAREKRSDASSDESVDSEDEDEEDEEKLIGRPAAGGARSVRNGSKKEKKQKRFWEMRSMDSGQTQPAQAGQSNNGMIVCVIVTVIVLVLLGVGGYFMYKQGMLSSIFPDSAASSSTTSPVAGATDAATVPTAGGMTDTAAITSNTDTAATGVTSAATDSSATDSSAASGMSSGASGSASSGASDASGSASASASGSGSASGKESGTEHSGSHTKSGHEDKSKSGDKTNIQSGMPNLFTQTLVTTIDGKPTTQSGYWANDGLQGGGGTEFKSHWVPKPTNIERLRRRVGYGEPPLAQASLTTLLPVQTTAPA